MLIALALGAALAYGVADFLGGSASRRASVLGTVAVCMPAGLLVLLAAAVLTGGRPTGAALAWGAASGLAGSSALITFFRALARGPMSVVAPVSALTAAVLPVAVGVSRGERLDGVVLGGVALCLAAIGLVSMEDKNDSAEPPAGRAMLRFLDSGPILAAVSGTGFGVFFVLLKEAGSGAGLWPVVASRFAGLGVIAVALAVVAVHSRRKDTPFVRWPVGAGVLAIAVTSGILDAAANALFFLAARDGLLSLAAILTSLYPAITVVLARAVYAERLRLVQQVGLLIAAAGVALVTVG